MTIHFNKIDQRKNLEEKIRNGHLSKELLQSLGVDENFSGLPLDHYSTGDSSVTISPKRGASIPSLILDNKEIFYNDPIKRDTPEQGIREGFRMGPQAGNFSEKDMRDFGYKLKQHGFLRDKERAKDSTSKEIAYILKNTPETLSQFPHPFTARQTIQIDKDRADIGLYVQNTGERPLPFAPGHHTYYKVDPSQKENIELDSNLKVTREMQKRWVNGEETFVLPNPGSTKLRIPGTGEIQVDYDPKFNFIRLRSEKDKGFVCVEPVVTHASKRLQSAILTKPGDIMNIGYSVKLLSKDSSH